jgi:alkylation response protein AidB-like acyl-CoA dehydrogenase
MNSGRHFEEFEIGAVYKHSPGRTITQADNIWFSLLTMNQQFMCIGEGTNEMQRIIIARQMLEKHPL